MLTLLALLLAATPVIIVSPVAVKNITTDGGSLLNVYVAGQAPGAGGLTDSELRASPLQVKNATDGGTVLNVYVAGQAAGAGGLTDAELRATPVPISGAWAPDGGALGSVSVTGSVAVTGTFYQATQPVSLASTTVTGFVAVTGPATDTQLRATPLPISGTVTASGPVTDTELRASAVPVSLTSTTVTGSVAVTGPATDTQLRATPLPISGTVTASGPVTDAELRASAIPVSLTSTTVTGSVATTMADRTYSHRAVAYAASPTPIAAASQAGAIGDLEGRQYVNTGHPRTITCNLSTTATTSTQVTGCELVASNSIYMTSITVGGGVATGATAPAIIQTGTSTGCTGPVVVYRCGHPAQSTCTITFPTPIKATSAHGICLLDATTGTKWVTITGYVAP